MCACGTRGNAGWRTDEALATLSQGRELGRANQNAKSAQATGRATIVRINAEKDPAERLQRALGNARFSPPGNCVVCVDILKSSIRGYQGADSIDFRIILQ